MLRYQIRALAQILLKPRASCSTAIQPKTASPLVEQLSKEFTNTCYITRTVQEEDVNCIHFDEWKSRIYLLKSHSFTDEDCFKMIAKYTNLLRIPIQNFEDSLNQWFDSNLGCEKFNLVLKTTPELIDIDVSEIPKRIAYFHFFCKKNPHILAKLLMDCPNVMIDNWTAVLSKIDYLLKVSNLNPPEIIKSKALSMPMDFIKFRIELLEKCGIFKQDNTPIHKVNKWDKTGHKNPSLMSILSETKNFIKVAKISAEEYQVCQDLFMVDEEDAEEVEEINTYEDKYK